MDIRYTTCFLNCLDKIRSSYMQECNDLECPSLKARLRREYHKENLGPSKKTAPIPKSFESATWKKDNNISAQASVQVDTAVEYQPSNDVEGLNKNTISNEVNWHENVKFATQYSEAESSNIADMLKNTISNEISEQIDDIIEAEYSNAKSMNNPTYLESRKRLNEKYRDSRRASIVSKRGSTSPCVGVRRGSRRESIRTKHLTQNILGKESKILDFGNEKLEENQICDYTNKSYIRQNETPGQNINEDNIYSKKNTRNSKDRTNRKKLASKERISLNSSNAKTMNERKGTKEDQGRKEAFMHLERELFEITNLISKIKYKGSKQDVIAFLMERLTTYLDKSLEEINITYLRKMILTALSEYGIAGNTKKMKMTNYIFAHDLAERLIHIRMRTEYPNLESFRRNIMPESFQNVDFSRVQPNFVMGDIEHHLIKTVKESLKESFVCDDTTAVNDITNILIEKIEDEALKRSESKLAAVSEINVEEGESEKVSLNIVAGTSEILPSSNTAKNENVTEQPRLSGSVLLYDNNMFQSTMTSTPAKEVPKLIDNETAYIEKLAKLINEWLNTVNKFVNKELGEVTVYDLARDIVDHERVYQLTPDTNVNKNRPRQELIFKWCLKFGIFKDFNHAETSIAELGKKIKEIEVPDFTQNHRGTGQIVTNGKHLVKGNWIQDVAQEVIDIIKKDIYNKDYSQQQIKDITHTFGQKIQPLLAQNEIKDSTTSKLSNKIQALKDDPQSYNENEYYKEDLSLYIARKKDTELLKSDLRKSLIEVKQGINEIVTAENYKQLLKIIVDTSIPKSIIGQKKSAFEFYKSKLADIFVIENLDYSNTENKIKYENAITQELDEGFSFIGNVVPLSKEELFNNLYSLLYKVPLPTGNAIVDIVEETKTKYEIKDWFGELPVIFSNNLEELNQLDQHLNWLAKRVHEIEKDDKNPDEYIYNEVKTGVVHLLTRQKSNIHVLTQNLVKKLKATTKDRKCLPYKNYTHQRKFIKQYPSEPLSAEELKQIRILDTRKRGVVIMSETVESWFNQLPIAVSSEYERETIINLAVTDILEKLSELNSDPNFFASEMLYEYVVGQELDRVLNNLPQNCDLDRIKEWRMKLMEGITQARNVIIDERVMPKYMDDLRYALAIALPRPTISASLGEITRFENMEDRVITNFVEYTYNKDDKDAKRFYKNRIFEYVMKYITSTPVVKVDPLLATNQIISEMSKLPRPKNEILRDEVQRIRMRNEVEYFIKDNIPRKKYELCNILRNRFKNSLSKLLAEIEKTGHNGDNDDKMKREIKNAFNKLGAEASDKKISHFIEVLIATEPFRKVLPFRKSEPKAVEQSQGISFNRGQVSKSILTSLSETQFRPDVEFNHRASQVISGCNKNVCEKMTPVQSPADQVFTPDTRSISGGPQVQMQNFFAMVYNPPTFKELQKSLSQTTQTQAQNQHDIPINQPNLRCQGAQNKQNPAQPNFNVTEKSVPTLHQIKGIYPYEQKIKYPYPEPSIDMSADLDSFIPNVISFGPPSYYGPLQSTADQVFNWDSQSITGPQAQMQKLSATVHNPPTFIELQKSLTQANQTQAQNQHDVPISEANLCCQEAQNIQDPAQPNFNKIQNSVPMLHQVQGIYPYQQKIKYPYPDSSIDMSADVDNLRPLGPPSYHGLVTVEQVAAQNAQSFCKSFQQQVEQGSGTYSGQNDQCRHQNPTLSGAQLLIEAQRIQPNISCAPKCTQVAACASVPLIPNCRSMVDQEYISLPNNLHGSVELPMSYGDRIMEYGPQTFEQFLGQFPTLVSTTSVGTITRINSEWMPCKKLRKKRMLLLDEPNCFCPMRLTKRSRIRPCLFGSFLTLD